MIPNGKVLHHLAVRKLSVVKTEITSKHDGGSHCFNCLHSFTTENKHEFQKVVL